MTKILVVDDRPRDKLRTVSIANEFGDVEEASDLMEAISILESTSEFDLLIVDTCLNGSFPDSAPVIELAKSKGIYVIAVSSIDSYRNYTLGAGADAFVKKCLMLSEYQGKLSVAIDLT